MPSGFTFGANTTFGTSTLRNQGDTQTTVGGFQFGNPPSTNLFNTQSGFAVSNLPTSITSSNTSTAGTTFGAGLSINTNTSATSSNGQSVASTASVPIPSFGTSLATLSSTIPLSSSALNSTTTTSTPSFNFGLPVSKTPTLGSSTVTSTIGTLAFGIGDNKITTVTTPLNTATPTPATLGLGGLATSQTKTGTSITTQKEIPPKELPLPNEILQTIEVFKDVIKQQKLNSSDIARCSVRDFRKVEQEIDLLSKLLSEVEKQLQKNRHLAEKLKYDTAKCLHNVEIAQRTQDTPPGLQYENIAPLRYFLELADLFESEMQTLKIQIESADKYVKNHRNPDILTPQDLALGMRQLHETFVALAGRLQSVHGQVETQKETYLNVRRQLCNEFKDPFNKLNKPEMELNKNNLKNVLIYSPPKVATGPTPFNNLALSNGRPLTNQHQLSSGHSGHSTNVSSLGVELSNHSSNTSIFGSIPFGQTSFGISASNFQLQKPPTGNKRGKQ